MNTFWNAGLIDSVTLGGSLITRSIKSLSVRTRPQLGQFGFTSKCSMAHAVSYWLREKHYERKRKRVRYRVLTAIDDQQNDMIQRTYRRKTRKSSHIERPTSPMVVHIDCNKSVPTLFDVLEVYPICGGEERCWYSWFPTAIYLPTTNTNQRHWRRRQSTWCLVKYHTVFYDSAKKAFHSLTRERVRSRTWTKDYRSQHLPLGTSSMYNRLLLT